MPCVRDACYTHHGNKACVTHWPSKVLRTAFVHRPGNKVFEAVLLGERASLKALFTLKF